MALYKQWADSSLFILFLSHGASLVFITLVAEGQIRKSLMHEVRASVVSREWVGQNLSVKMMWKRELSAEDILRTS